ncbi:DUF3558 domain-containing protein [Amycolatopsis rubida]|uniref:DUF3558 domain-containing protein n=1 Tax=Amycolatopsis rubida TaxID=112413 RepID=A0ABX0BNH7_9PSEU|nr:MULTISPECIES: DUF3558 domain-containing protein [Amycolatopsis]MYW92199.1 DUF3558 domain-containing protein [Amycolatopsis rubida]NEC57186.1 DUF3558 domain-containing protein [Amycolatopsis rubida]OAP27052.1 hypothetical protein A4R44_01857 [Amycolatopsis sp. M39]
MPHRTVRLATAAVAAFGLLTACGGGTGGTAEPPATAGSSTPADNGGTGPKVPAPLPAKDVVENPCSVLNAAEADDVGLKSPGEKSTGSLGGCRWTSTASNQNFVNIGALPQNKNGISDIYAQKDKQAYFTPTSIDGYPAVFADTQDGRPSGSCSLWVGVTDQLAVSVIPNIGVGPHRSDPCGIAEKAATAMIKHLKGA